MSADAHEGLVQWVEGELAGEFGVREIHGLRVATAIIARIGAACAALCRDPKRRAEYVMLGPRVLAAVANEIEALTQPTSGGG